MGSKFGPTGTALGNPANIGPSIRAHDCTVMANDTRHRERSYAARAHIAERHGAMGSLMFVSAIGALISSAARTGEIGDSTGKLWASHRRFLALHARTTFDFV
jgi:hypothetical protein